MPTDWRDSAIVEAKSVNKLWATHYDWNPTIVEDGDFIDLFIQFRLNSDPDQIHVLRLRYESDFQTAGRREAFVNPENRKESNREFWPDGISAIKKTRNPPVICLRGTWGFHSDLHKDRDGRTANLNTLLIEIQKCMNP